MQFRTEKSCFSGCDGRTTGLNAEDISLDQFFGERHMSVVMLDVRVVAPDDPHCPPDLAGRNQIDKRLERTPQCIFDCLIGEPVIRGTGSPGISTLCGFRFLKFSTAILTIAFAVR